MGRQRGRSKGKRAACRGVGSNIKSLTRQAGRDSSVHVSGLWCRARLPSQCWQYLFIGIPPTLLLPLLLLLLLLASAAAACRGLLLLLRHQVVQQGPAATRQGRRQHSVPLRRTSRAHRVCEALHDAYNSQAEPLVCLQQEGTAYSQLLCWGLVINLEPLLLQCKQPDVRLLPWSRHQQTSASVPATCRACVHPAHQECAVKRPSCRLATLCGRTDTCTTGTQSW